MFTKIELTPEEPKEPEKPKKKINRKKWVPSDEYIKMVIDTLIAEGFPKSRLRLVKKKRKVRMLLKCRGYDEIHFVFRKFYTPHHVRQFLKLMYRWDDPERRPKRGRPRKPKVSPPRKPRALDRRTKAWRKQMLHKFKSPVTGITYPLVPKRRRVKLGSK
jgi:hypothetical protein